jgi:LacI family transcriptional regulator
MDMTEKKDFKEALDEIHNFYHYLYEIKKNENINVVTISQKIGDIPNIDFDFKEQSSITMNYLFNKGYKDISFINAKFKDGLWQTKEDVYLKMMKDKNFDDYINIEYCNVDINSGYEAMKSLLEKRIPKAVYCANDVIACGAIQAILEKDLKIPKDIAVIGNDDMQLCEYIYPKLTSINLGTKELGIKAFKSLLSIINNDSISDSLMTPYLVERKTV